MRGFFSAAILLVTFSLQADLKSQDDVVNNLKKEAIRTCQQTSECRMSCRLGGVSKDWYNKNARKIAAHECLDGCAGWGHQVKCLERKCTIVDSSDKIDKTCNFH
jgi:hypothetical protein